MLFPLFSSFFAREAAAASAAPEEIPTRRPSSFPKSGYLTRQEPINSFDCIVKVQNRYVVFQHGFIDSHAKHEALQDLAEQLFSKH